MIGNVFIGIPLNASREAMVGSVVWKTVACAHCGTTYHYRYRHNTTGVASLTRFLEKGGTTNRARQQTVEDLERKLLRGVSPVKCPECKRYQPDMQRLLRRHRVLQGAGSGLVFGALALLSVGTTTAGFATGGGILLLGLLLAGYFGFVWNPDLRDAAGDPTPHDDEERDEHRVRALRALLIAIILADGRVDDAEVEALGPLASEFGRVPDDEELHREIGTVEADPRLFEGFLIEINSLATDEDKHKILHAMSKMAAADGEIADEERDVVAYSAERLHFPKEQLVGIWESIENA